ncbi:hypothetical protein EYR41_004685 [Orbilia oligospora]|uniref:Uncharacterized protein n=1 Tax=Orbilia oligospora TaxID=2813651 RepID=A0A8H2E5H8_ORBOL|nr:hypothetical protein EYR41_004685 [Orbilia oligospora]
MHQHFVEDLKSPAGLSAQSPGPSDEYEAKFVFYDIKEPSQYTAILCPEIGKGHIWLVGDRRHMMLHNSVYGSRKRRAGIARMFIKEKNRESIPIGRRRTAEADHHNATVNILLHHQPYNRYHCQDGTRDR